MNRGPLHIDPVAQRYADSLLESCLENKAEKKVETDMDGLFELYSNSDELRNAMTSPIFSRDDMVATMDALGKKAKLNDLTTNFLKVLAKNNRLSSFNQTYFGFKQSLRKHRGEVDVHVASAYKLTATQEKDLAGALKKGLGQDISMTNTVDKDLLGGVVLQVGSLMIDDSVKNKLNRLKKQLKSGSQDNTQLKEVS